MTRLLVGILLILLYCSSSFAEVGIGPTGAPVVSGGISMEVTSCFVIETSQFGGKNIRVTLYDSNRDLVATTDETAIDGNGVDNTTNKTYELTFTGNPTLTSSSVYYGVVMSDNFIRLAFTADSNAMSYVAAAGSYPIFDDPLPSDVSDPRGKPAIWCENAASDVILGIDNGGSIYGNPNDTFGVSFLMWTLGGQTTP